MEVSRVVIRSQVHLLTIGLRLMFQSFQASVSSSSRWDNRTQVTPKWRGGIWEVETLNRGGDGRMRERVD